MADPTPGQLRYGYYKGEEEPERLAPGETLKGLEDVTREWIDGEEGEATPDGVWPLEPGMASTVGTWSQAVRVQVDTEREGTWLTRGVRWLVHFVRRMIRWRS